MLTQVERDWRRANDLRGTRREASPADFSSQAERVEQRRIIGLYSGWQDMALPGASWKFHAIELCDHGPEPLRTGEPAGRLHVLPVEEKPHECRGSDRGDLGAQPV